MPHDSRLPPYLRQQGRDPAGEAPDRLAGRDGDPPDGFHALKKGGCPESKALTLREKADRRWGYEREGCRLFCGPV